MSSKISGTWDIEAEKVVEPLLPGNTRTVRLESADLVTKDGYRHPQGAYRVTVNGKVFTQTKGYRLKGESAWSEGRRLFGDVVLSIQYGRQAR